MEQNTKLLDYINRIIELEDGEEYLKVSDIGYVFTELCGTEKTVSGEIVNNILRFNLYQVPLEDDEAFKYYPTDKFELFEECVNEEMGYGIIKWHYSIIPKLLNIDFDKNVEENIDRINGTFSYIRFIMSCHANEDILKKELLKIGIAEK